MFQQVQADFSEVSSQKKCRLLIGRLEFNLLGHVRKGQFWNRGAEGLAVPAVLAVLEAVLEGLAVPAVLEALAVPAVLEALAVLVTPK